LHRRKKIASVNSTSLCHSPLVTVCYVSSLQESWSQIYAQLWPYRTQHKQPNDTKE